MLNENDQLKIMMVIGSMYSTLKNIKSYCELNKRSEVKAMATETLNFVQSQLSTVDWEGNKYEL